MQFRFAQVLAAVVLASSVAASIQADAFSGIVVRSSADVHSHAVHFEQRGAKVSHEQATRSALERIENDVQLLTILKGNGAVSIQLEAPIFDDLTKHIKAVTASLSASVKAHKSHKRDVLQPALVQLVEDVGHVLCKLYKLLRELTKNATGSNKLNEELINPVIKYLDTAVDDLSSSLLELAPGLGHLLDPVLKELATGLNGLGLRSVSVTATGSASATGSVSVSHKKLEAELEKYLDIITKDAAKLEKLLGVSVKVNTPAAKALIKDVLKDAAAASKAVVNAVNASRQTKGKGKKRADSTEEIFNPLLVRLVHDLICVLHAVIKLIVNLTGKLGLDGLQSLVKELDGKLLEPIFDSLKSLSKELGSKLSPDLDPLLAEVQDLLKSLSLA